MQVVVVVVVVLGEMCEVDCGQNRQKTTNGVRGRGKKAGGGKQTKIKEKMGKEYKQRGEN